MEIGMLWRDDSQRTLEEKVSRAVQYYAHKYGRMPNLCFVNEAAVDEDGLEVAAVRVRPALDVLPQHFWVGVKKI